MNARSAVPTDPGADDAASRRPTMSQVAALAGVSVQTVSNVLNTPGIVRPETAAKVRDVIRELDYRPNHAARQLRTKRSGLIGVRVESGSTDGVFDRFLHALTACAADRDYRVLLYTARDDDQELASYDDLMQRWDLDGFVLSHTHEGDRRAAHLMERGIPCVSFGRDWDGAGTHPWVDVDGAQGTRKATGHLLAQGHRRIAFLGWPTDSRVGNDRLAGYRAAMQAAGLPDLPVGHCRNAVDDARLAAHDLLRRTDATALVCVSDLVALGALAAVQLRQATPGAPAVEVVGFDDTALAEGAGISSVAQPLTAAAEQSLRLLMDRIDRPTTVDPPTRLLLAPDLVVRTRRTPPS